MKYRYFLLPLAGMLIVAAIIVSCSKQEPTELNSSAPETSQSADDIQIENKIRAFKQELTNLRENPHFKSGETMQVDSAIWYMEAASNQTYGDAATPFVDYAIDSCKITIPTSNGTILYNDILNAYDQMIDSLSAKYNLLPYENKHLVMNDVTLEFEDESTTTLGITAGFGAEGEGTTALFNYPWWYAGGDGRCDGSGLGEGSDAAEEIEDKIHARKGTLPPNHYYTDPEVVEIESTSFINPNDTTSWDNMYDYMMFYNLEHASMPNIHWCITVDEMNFYFLSTENIMYMHEPMGARPAGKDFISVDLWGDQLELTYQIERLHFAEIQYGVLHLNSEPPTDL